VKVQDRISISQSLLLVAIVFSVMSILLSPLVQIASAALIAVGAYIIISSEMERDSKLAVISAYLFFGIFSLALPYLSSFAISSGSFFSGLFIIIIILITALVLWKVKFSRNYCLGKVLLAEGNLAGVEVEYDMRANVRAGRYVVDNPVKAKKGQKARVLVKKSSLSGSTPCEIIEVVK
jgi:uncharacterized membrane protein